MSRQKINRPMKADFENSKDHYAEIIQGSLPFSNVKHDFYTEVKAACLVRLFQERGARPEAAEVLDIGCGVGLTDTLLIPHFGRLAGVDISPGVIELAARRNPSARYLVYDGNILPFPDNAFDLVIAVNVLHHVAPQQWRQTVLEMKRVCKEGGMVAVFEHNPYNPLTRLVVSRCELDTDAVLLACRETVQLFEQSGLRRVGRGHILFFPFRGKVFRWVEDRLRWLPFGAQYYVVGGKATGAP